MVKCVCGKSIEKIPAWLESVTVDFVCNNCPKRQIKSISQLHAEQTAAAAKLAEPQSLSIDDHEDDDEPED